MFASPYGWKLPPPTRILLIEQFNYRVGKNLLAVYADHAAWRLRQPRSWIDPAAPSVTKVFTTGCATCYCNLRYIIFANYWMFKRISGYLCWRRECPAIWAVSYARHEHLDNRYFVVASPNMTAADKKKPNSLANSKTLLSVSCSMFLRFLYRIGHTHFCSIQPWKIIPEPCSKPQSWRRKNVAFFS